ncbi:MAG: GGDEF domain-containing protein [Vicinamibacterales bacterium]
MLPPSAELASALTVAALLGVFALDSWSGEAPVQHLYYLPILYAAVRFGTRGGLLASTAAIVLYHLAKPNLWRLGHTEADVLQIILFSAFGPVVGRLTRDASHLYRLAMTDDLTGLHNLRSFNLHFTRLIAACRTSGQPLSLLVLDMDRLKSINDTHGHMAGAEAVRTLGRMIGQSLPAGAVACRYGGDELVAVLPLVSVIEACDWAERLRGRVQSAAPDLAGTPFPPGTLSVSVGIVSWQSTPDDVSADAALAERLFREADAALYAAKRLGRNRVHIGVLGEPEIGAAV